MQFDYLLDDVPLVSFEDGRNYWGSGQPGRVWYSQEESDSSFQYEETVILLCQPCEGKFLYLISLLIRHRLLLTSIGCTFILWKHFATCCVVLVLVRLFKVCNFVLHSDSSCRFLSLCISNCQSLEKIVSSNDFVGALYILWREYFPECVRITIKADLSR